MKRLFLIALCALTLVGCTNRTPYGPCIGISDELDPALNYKPNSLNIVLGVIFIETIIVPACVVFYQFQCPIGKKAQ